MATDQERDAPPAVPAAGSPGKGEETETAHAGGEPVVQEAVVAVGGAVVAGGAARAGAGSGATAGSGSVKGMASSRT